MQIRIGVGSWPTFFGKKIPKKYPKNLQDMMANQFFSGFSYITKNESVNKGSIDKIIETKFRAFRNTLLTLNKEPTESLEEYKQKV